MKSVFRKEMRQYRTGWIGAVFLAAITALVGYYFTVGNLFAQNGEISQLFHSVLSLLMFLIPVLTMRLLAEEKKLRTDQLLFTSPLSVGQIVMGKFWAAFVIFLLGSASLVLAVVILACYGCFQPLTAAGNLLGLWLAGAAFISVGLFASAVTENQMVAAVLSYVLLLGLWLLDFLRLYVTDPFLLQVLAYLSSRTHFQELSSGVFSLSTLVYFLSITGLMLGLTNLTLESKRYS